MEKNQTQTIEVINPVEINPESSPLVHLNGWDFIILFLAVLLRFVVMAKNKIRKLENSKKEFNVYEYFDFKHVFRWVSHIITALIGLLVFPEIFINYIQPKYFEGLEIWTLFGSGLIGFLGYDIIRVIEKIGEAFISKFGVKLNE